MLKKALFVLLSLIFSLPVYADGNCSVNVSAKIKTSKDAALFGEYLENAAKKVEENFKFENSCMAQNVIVMTKIINTGAPVAKPWFMKSSPSKEYNAAAMEAVRAAAPFGNFPDGASQTGKLIYFTFSIKQK